MAQHPGGVFELCPHQGPGAGFASSACGESLKRPVAPASALRPPGPFSADATALRQGCLCCPLDPSAGQAVPLSRRKPASRSLSSAEAPIRPLHWTLPSVCPVARLELAEPSNPGPREIRLAALECRATPAHSAVLAHMQSRTCDSHSHIYAIVHSY